GRQSLNGNLGDGRRFSWRREQRKQILFIGKGLGGRDTVAGGTIDLLLQLAHTPLQLLDGRTLLIDNRACFIERYGWQWDTHAIRKIRSIDFSFRSKKIGKSF